MYSQTRWAQNLAKVGAYGRMPPVRGGRSRVVKASGCGPEDRGFESHRSPLTLETSRSRLASSASFGGLCIFGGTSVYRNVLATLTS